MEKQDAAARYLAHIGEKEPEIVDVIPPSGFVFKFEKPSKYGMLFRAGRLPQAAASIAVESWKEKGLLPEGVEVTADQEQQIQLAQNAFDLRDKVLELSREPKLVVGEALNPGELSTDRVSDEDLDYLFKWVAAGGSESAMLSAFPDGSGKRPMASASRRKVRAAA